MAAPGITPAISSEGGAVAKGLLQQTLLIPGRSPAFPHISLVRTRRWTGPRPITSKEECDCHDRSWPTMTSGQVGHGLCLSSEPQPAPGHLNTGCKKVNKEGLREGRGSPHIGLNLSVSFAGFWIKTSQVYSRPPLKSQSANFYLHRRLHHPCQNIPIPLV